MSETITVEEAQAHLRELIDNLAPGEELVITDHQQPVAKLVAARPAERKLGTMRGTVRYMAPDFNGPIADFSESGERPAGPPRPAPGLGKGSVLYMAPDFDETMEDSSESVASHKT